MVRQAYQSRTTMIFFLIRTTSPIWWLYGVFYVGFEMLPNGWFSDLFANWWGLPTLIALAASAAVPIALFPWSLEYSDPDDPYP